MKVQVTFNFINPEFDIEYAKRYHFGKESDSNWRLIGAETMTVNDVQLVSLIKDEDFVINVSSKNGEISTYSIPNVTIFRCFLVNGKTIYFGVSNSILKKKQKTPSPKYNITRLYFYITQDYPSVRLLENLIVDEIDVPISLRKNK